MKHLIILSAQVKYPSGDYAYLTANSYVLEKQDANLLEAIANDFRTNIETDGFKITNLLVYIVPQEQITECSLQTNSTP